MARHDQQRAFQFLALLGKCFISLWSLPQPWNVLNASIQLHRFKSVCKNRIIIGWAVADNICEFENRDIFRFSISLTHEKLVHALPLVIICWITNTKRLFVSSKSWNRLSYVIDNTHMAGIIFEFSLQLLKKQQLLRDKCSTSRGHIP